MYSLKNRPLENNGNKMKLSGLIICCILVLSATGFAQSNYAVLMEESPVGAGEIKPGIGVYTFNVNETVTLTTIAKPGWRFVYWLGDVFDPTASRTMLAVDGPKIIIAVFQRNEYELPGIGTAVSCGPEGLTRRVDSISGGGQTSGGIIQDDPPVPNLTPNLTLDPTPDPIPEPVPEPQMIVMLSIGAYIGLRKRLSAKINRYHRHQGPGPRNPLCE
jgi:hypothetical protein